MINVVINFIDITSSFSPIFMGVPRINTSNIVGDTAKIISLDNLFNF